MAAACRGEMSAAGVGGLVANAAHPLAADAHAITSKASKQGRGMEIPLKCESLVIITKIVEDAGFVHLHVSIWQTNGALDRRNRYRFTRRRRGFGFPCFVVV